MDAGNWITVAGLVSGLIAFAAGLWRYNESQRWKRAEFVATEMKAFEHDGVVRNVMAMLDWTTRELPLRPDSAVQVTDEKLRTALEPHREHVGGHDPTKSELGHFEEEDALIRDCFDQFLDYLERFQHFVDARLITTGDLRPYLEYWINGRLTMPDDAGDAVHSKEFFESVSRYIDSYGYSGVRKLIDNFREFRAPERKLSQPSVSQVERSARG